MIIRNCGYYPAWITGDTYTLIGRKLKPRTEMITENYWVNHEYEWGYSDNFSPIDRLADDDNHNASVNCNYFKISNAVTYDGRPADLKYIDFVKIQTGVQARTPRKYSASATTTCLNNGEPYRNILKPGHVFRRPVLPTAEEDDIPTANTGRGLSCYLP